MNKGEFMRLAILTVALFSMCVGVRAGRLPEGDANPYVKVTQVVKGGTIHVSVKNISHKPVVAYVLAVENAGQLTTHHDYFTGRDVFAPGKTVELVFAVPQSSGTPKVFVDYLRLADNSTWGNPVTDDGKDVAATFQK
jgi:hypothetical protein